MLLSSLLLLLTPSSAREVPEILAPQFVDAVLHDDHLLQVTSTGAVWAWRLDPPMRDTALTDRLSDPTRTLRRIASDGEHLYGMGPDRVWQWRVDTWEELERLPPEAGATLLDLVVTDARVFAVTDEAVVPVDRPRRALPLRLPTPSPEEIRSRGGYGPLQLRSSVPVSGSAGRHLWFGITQQVCSTVRQSARSGVASDLLVVDPKRRRVRRWTDPEGLPLAGAVADGEGLLAVWRRPLEALPRDTVVATIVRRHQLDATPVGPPVQSTRAHALESLHRTSTGEVVGTADDRLVRWTDAGIEVLATLPPVAPPPLCRLDALRRTVGVFDHGEALIVARRTGPPLRFVDGQIAPMEWLDGRWEPSPDAWFGLAWEARRALGVRDCDFAYETSVRILASERADDEARRFAQKIRNWAQWHREQEGEEPDGGWQCPAE